MDRLDRHATRFEANPERREVLIEDERDFRARRHDRASAASAHATASRTSSGSRP